MLVELYYDDKKLPNYFCDELGNIYSKKPNRPLRKLNPYQKENGYLVVTISINNKAKQYYVHRLIACAFLPNVGNYYSDVDHIDTDRTNNNVNNLRWTTRKGNCNNPISKGNYRESHLGDKNHNKGIPQHPKKVMNVTTGKIYPSIRDAAKDIKTTSHGSISNCCHGRQNTAGGYQWKFID